MSRVKSYMLDFFKLLLSAVAFTACTGLGEGYMGFQEQKYPVLISASTSIEETRISVDGTQVAWESDDKIQIFAKSGDSLYGSSELTWFSGIDGMDSHHASFSGFVTMSSFPETCCFTYPVMQITEFDPETEKITLYYNNQSGEHKPFMYARTVYDEAGMDVMMNHVGAMLEIDVQMENVAYLSFAGNKLESLSPVVVNPQTGEISFTSQANLQITVPVQTEGKTYIAVPPVNFENGFSIICSNADQTESMIKTFSTDGAYSSGYDFTSKKGHIIPIVLDGTLVNFEVSCSSVNIEHTRSSEGLITGTSATFNMQKQGSSDKIVEAWGATLVNQDGVIVREISYTNANPIAGQDVSMNIANDWKLLPAGTYVFTPYYRIYGQTVSLNSETVTVPDPDVTLTVSGSTSYDKYLSGNISGANGHQNTLIEGVSVSTNLDLSLISDYMATMDGTDMGEATITSGTSVTASYGNLTKTQWRAYEMAVSLNVGPLTFTAGRTFHITGLPYEADFTQSNPTGWSPAWTLLGNAKYSKDRVLINSGNPGASVSPGFHTPYQINVMASIDACGAHTQGGNRTFYITTCKSSSSSIVTTGASVVATYKVSYSSSGYKSCSSVFALDSNAQSLMFAVSPVLYNVAFYKAKIVYSE